MVAYNRMWRAASLCCVIGISTAVCAQPYRIVLIETLGGAQNSAADVSDTGFVVGTSELAGGGVSHAFRWRAGQVIDLGTAGSGLSSATAVNDSGQVAGFYTGEDLMPRAFLWTEGEMTDLGDLGGGSAYAFGMNRAGEVVGHSWTGSAWHAFRWHKGLMVSLGTLGGRDSQAHDINDHGLIVGYSDMPSSLRHPFAWHDGRLLDLGTLGGGEGFAFGVNRRGEVAGTSDNAAGKRRATMWGRGMREDLGKLPGDRVSWANAVSDDGTAVGYSYFNYDPHGPVDQYAVVFREGLAVDLNCYFPSVTGRIMQEAFGINESGWIVGRAVLGEGKFNIRSRAFVLVPEPGAVALSSPVPGRAGAVNVFEVTNVTPGAAVHLYYSRQSSCTAVEGCEAARLALDAPGVVGWAVADKRGVALIKAFVTEAAGERAIMLQAAELAGCRTSAAVIHRFE